MTALLHFDKLLQIPFVLLNHLYALDYQALLTTFAEGPLPPVLSEIRRLFADKALAGQKVTLFYKLYGRNLRQPISGKLFFKLV